MQQGWVDERLFEEGAGVMNATLRWSADEGWHACFSSRTPTEGPGVPDEDRQDPATSYGHLSTSELIDVLEAEADRRRRFR